MDKGRIGLDKGRIGLDKGRIGLDKGRVRSISAAQTYRHTKPLSREGGLCIMHRVEEGARGRGGCSDSVERALTYRRTKPLSRGHPSSCTTWAI